MSDPTAPNSAVTPTDSGASSTLDTPAQAAPTAPIPASVPAAPPAVAPLLPASPQAPTAQAASAQAAPVQEAIAQAVPVMAQPPIAPMAYAQPQAAFSMAQPQPISDPTLGIENTSTPPSDSIKPRRTWARPALAGMVGTFVALALFSGGVFVGRATDQDSVAAVKGLSSESGSSEGGSTLEELLRGEGSENDSGSTESDPRSKMMPSLPEESSPNDSGGSSGQSQGSPIMLSGTISAISGSTFTLTTQRGDVNVTTDSDIASSSLVVGTVVMVIGSADSDGNLAASKILINNDGTGTGTGGTTPTDWT